MKLAIAVVVVVAAGCDPLTKLHGRITIDPQFAPPADARVLIVVRGFPTPTTFAPIGQAGDDLVVDFVPAQLQYDFQDSAIGGFGHAVYVGAFIDLDHDSVLGSNDPYGVSGANPLIDPPDDAAGTVANVSIAMRVP